MDGADRLCAARDRADGGMGGGDHLRADARAVDQRGAAPVELVYVTVHWTGRLSRPRNAQPPIFTSADGSSRSSFSRANSDGSATSATIAREANAPAQ